MNCANHPDRERTAFCQNCGKPLCAECVRRSGGSIFCEPCLVARTGAAPYGGYPPGSIPPVPPGVPSVPNPVIAGLLGLIPGVGAMYNEQYAKGFVHLIVFAILIALADSVHGVFGVFIPAWVCYMVIEAYQTARARRDGTPLPNPFGLNDIGERIGFGKSWPSAGAPPSYYQAGPAPEPIVPPAANPGAAPNTPPYTYVPPASNWGAPQDYGTQQPFAPPVVPPVGPGCGRIPTGAIWLIGLGALFLLGNIGLFHFGRYFVPLMLIGFGVWNFVNRMTMTGHGLENDGTPHYQWRLAHALNSAAWLVLVGVIWLLDELHILRWHSSWPLFMICAGVLLILKRSMYSSFEPPYPPQPPAGSPPAPAVSSTAIVPSESRPNAGSSEQEGR